ncbi:MAG: ATP-binding cassette domain-containing protein [Chloroherpetonaceae bacterium]|nr:ATP-binding cassette domain-containing protein [Chloroherpetonaceae bacterium]MDW8437124.1 ATP-binding cassette domain-containing protein [Chloroherpetonaceae bacterium]
MKPVIVVEHLVKEYKVFKKEEGLLGAIKGLFNRRYEIKRAVDDISFEIHEGELVGFLGANGAGKTTTLKILSGLLYPTSGKVEVLGYAPYERKNEFRKQFAIVLGQKNQLLWDLPAQDSFLLLKEIYEVPDAQYREQLSRLSELLNVKDKLGVQLRRLSLGERMKMEFIGALLHKPKALFLDEPTIGLDVVAQQTIRDFIKRYNEESKTTIILTSHYMQDIEALCKRVMIIDGGKLFFDGALSDIIDKFSSEKILTLDFHSPIEREALSEFGTIESFEGSSARLRVARQNISKVSAAILSRFDVQDLTIEEVPIEDIIRRLYLRESER